MRLWAAALLLGLVGCRSAPDLLTEQPPPKLEPGWSTITLGKGISISLPKGWVRLEARDPKATAKWAELVGKYPAEMARIKDAGTRETYLGAAIDGSTVKGFMPSYMIVETAEGQTSGNIDELIAKLREEAPERMPMAQGVRVDRIELPIGPAAVLSAMTPLIDANGQAERGEMDVYYLLHGNTFLTFTFVSNGSSAKAASFEAAMNTLRIKD